NGRVVTRQLLRGKPVRRDLDAPERFEQLLADQADYAFLAEIPYGTSTTSNTRRTMSSAVTSSASASYESTTRCRSTSGPMALTSSGVTYPRCRRNAWARAARFKAMLARGLPPYSMSGARSLRPFL